MKIKILTRKSKLALNQVKEVTNSFPKLQYEIIALDSFGDKNKNISLLINKQENIFTKELDDALLNDEADIAIHSAKDLSYPLPLGLEVIALTNNFDDTDSLVSKNNFKLHDLPKNVLVGTSSTIRKKQLLAVRPDIKIVSIRGTIEERITLLEKNQLDAVIIATCALKRLNLSSKISEILKFTTHHLQGQLAIVAKYGEKNLTDIFKAIDIREKYGTVYLVGFGPGEPDLLTIKADKILESIDVILYDNLVSLNSLHKYKVEKIYVGKKRNNHVMDQDSINNLMYRLAREGKNVARVKGGDPFIFGRGGEELTYLKKRLINVEIIPGITSAACAAAYTETPLTQRNVAGSVAFCTGHPIEKITIPDADVLVYYMGAANIKIIIEKMLLKGWNPHTAVSIITDVSKYNQKIKTSTLTLLLKSKEKVVSPSVIIIGKTVHTNNDLTWFSQKKKILYTGIDPTNFSSLGYIVHQPLIEILPLTSYTLVDQTLREIKNHDWIIFTSKHTVYYFFKRLKELGQDTRSLTDLNIASIGKMTSKELAKNGLLSNLQPKEESSFGLLKIFSEQKKRILIPRSNKALNILPQGLESLNNIVTAFPIYENKMPKTIEKIDLLFIDTLVFTSPSCVINFKIIYGKIPASIEVYAIGDVTKNTVEMEFKNAKIKTL
ncbi:MAG: uroporphyrinogen-III C-methyltransferase [Bacteroidetes bacterium]|nr:uroporphyrinogen-III C-methyltransferase [Bacteroidota bacterium]